jgi:hypothetical protein
MSLRMDDELYEWLRLQAYREHTTLTRLVNEALREKRDRDSEPAPASS